MSNIKKIVSRFLLVVCLGCSTSFGSLSPANPPLAFSAYGQTSSATLVANLQCAGADGYNIILDGTAVATSTITVTVQVLNTGTGAYVTPATIGTATNPITVTNATAQVVNVPGGYPGIQVTVTSFGTATGTFKCIIYAY
jgi:hypothetical protein